MVYVLMGSWRYAGDQLIGVYSTLEAAQKAYDKIALSGGYDELTIHEGPINSSNFNAT